jgi:hypothetical protein
MIFKMFIWSKWKTYKKQSREQSVKNKLYKHQLGEKT